MKYWILDTVKSKLDSVLGQFWSVLLHVFVFQAFLFLYDELWRKTDTEEIKHRWDRIIHTVSSFSAAVAMASHFACMDACTCAHKHACPRRREVHIQYLLQSFSVLYFDISDLSVNLGLTDSAGLASQQTPGVSLHLLPQSWGYRCVPAYLALYTSSRDWMRVLMLTQQVLYQLCLYFWLLFDGLKKRK